LLLEREWWVLEVDEDGQILVLVGSTEEEQSEE